MWEGLIGRAERAGRERVRALIGDVAGRLRAELPNGIEVAESEAGIVLTGRGIRARFALDPALRWLLVRVR